jgi:hypothetical protein
VLLAVTLATATTVSLQTAMVIAAIALSVTASVTVNSLMLARATPTRRPSLKM